jgi:hypothetical protein
MCLIKGPKDKAKTEITDIPDGIISKEKVE